MEHQLRRGCFPLQESLYVPLSIRICELCQSKKCDVGTAYVAIVILVPSLAGVRTVEFIFINIITIRRIVPQDTARGHGME